MVAQSGGEVNWLRDRCPVECLPTTDATHGDLSRGRQRPEQNGRRFRIPEPSDSMILIFGLRLEGHSVIFLTMQTPLSCRFPLAVEFLKSIQLWPSKSVSIMSRFG
jgi:hypothetical protein